ncbi:hypothetical protein DKG34_39130 [Streptomyces sp. NWU49]|uniref:hypothetical protein n=1 Tax=Streptomyces sp. NWU49 TaxID=2201153 RepID=UPI000D675377|nr:hypothetical protein [Streptomyces sp. NWU49]PWJ02357.1 hypothetical protein DKG34_39130 [Streptomyces sp. NWU49]
MTLTEYSVFALSPDKSGVYHYHDEGWIKVGGPAGRLYGGDLGLVATNPDTGNLYLYLNQPDRWRHIGGPGASFAVTKDSVYGLSPDKSGVYRYDGHDTSWTKVGGPAGRLYGGDWGLVATNPDTGDVYGYRYIDPADNPDQPAGWGYLGGPGADFSVTYENVFGLSPDRGGVWRLRDGGSSWQQIGGPAESIAAALWVSTHPDSH